MSDLQHERITALTAELRLGAMADLYGAIAQDAANRKDASYADFLEQVLRALVELVFCGIPRHAANPCPDECFPADRRQN